MLVIEYKQWFITLASYMVDLYLPDSMLVEMFKVRINPCINGWCMSRD